MIIFCIQNNYLLLQINKSLKFQFQKIRHNILRNFTNIPKNTVSKSISYIQNTKFTKIDIIELLYFHNHNLIEKYKIYKNDNAHDMLRKMRE